MAQTKEKAMRDLLLFAVCCGLAAAFWLTSVRRSEQRAAAMQAELYQLGAPQTMDDSPERSLLLGDFVQGLRADPGPETYRRLAALFLVSDQLQGRKVVTSAFHSEGMARVAGKNLELFDAQGKPITAKLLLLEDKVKPWDKPLFEASGSATLVADGPWLLYQDKVRSAAFRSFGDQHHGYISTKKLGVDDDTLLIAGKKAWVWSQGHLEAVPSGD